MIISTDSASMRVGEFPNSLDIREHEMGSYYGVHAVIDMLMLPGDNRFVEVREKANKLAVFAYKYGKDAIPEYWQDAKVIWSKGGEL